MSGKAGDINLIELLNNQIAALYMSEHCSDIALYVEGQKIPAHRSIISARCEYLNTYFTNGLSETNQNNFELNVPLEAFKVIMEYFYTGQICLSKIKDVEILIQILNLVEEYCLFYLKTHFEKYFKQILSFENTCRLLEIAEIYELKELKIKSLNLIDTNADQILASESFAKIPNDLLENILTRDTFHASSELSIYRAVTEWSKHANRNIETVIHLVKLPLIPLEELLRIRNLGSLTGDKIFDAIEKQIVLKPSLRSGIQTLGQLPKQNENVASAKYNVRIIQRDALILQGDPGIKYQHKITETNDSGIVIELGQIFIINHFKMKLLGTYYSYFIEISTDQKKWERIIDYSSYKCGFLQTLYFSAKPIKYVKIVGTFSNRQLLNVETFEAYYEENIPEIRNVIVVPNEKVKHLGPFPHDNSILIILNQPYYIDSMKFFVEDNNRNQRYKFYIETSLNKEDWEEVADKRDEFVTGWQSFRFTSKPISFIRIVPTACTDHRMLDEFRIKDFECPCPV